MHDDAPGEEAAPREGPGVLFSNMSRNVSSMMSRAQPFKLANVALGAPPGPDAGALEAGAARGDAEPAGVRLAPAPPPPSPGESSASPAIMLVDAAGPDGAGGAGDGGEGGGWTARCLLKCAPEVSIKKTTRMGAKIDEYEKDKGAGLYPYCAFIGDSLRASVVCQDAEAFWKTYEALRGDPDDPNQRLKVLRLKNKIGKGKEPFNFHLNCSFHPNTFREPIQLEIQIWAAPIMDLNDVSHRQYEVSRADKVSDF